MFVFILSAIGIFIASVGCSILSLILACIPICMIYFGLKHVNDCPASNFIPAYVIVTGLIAFIDQVIHFVQYRCITRFKKTEETSTETTTDKKKVSTNFSTQFILFRLIWTIIGAVFIYGAYKPNYEDKTADNYCNETVYLFAFWPLTLLLVFFGIVIACSCCCCSAGIAGACFGKKETSTPTPTTTA